MSGSDHCTRDRITLYHGTSARFLDTIRERGLSPSGGVPVFLAADEDWADWFAVRAALCDFLAGVVSPNVDNAAVTDDALAGGVVFEVSVDPASLRHDTTCWGHFVTFVAVPPAAIIRTREFATGRYLECLTRGQLEVLIRSASAKQADREKERAATSRFLPWDGSWDGRPERGLGLFLGEPENRELRPAAGRRAQDLLAARRGGAITERSDHGCSLVAHGAAL